MEFFSSERVLDPGTSCSDRMLNVVQEQWITHWTFTCKLDQESSQEKQIFHGANKSTIIIWLVTYKSSFKNNCLR